MKRLHFAFVVPVICFIGLNTSAQSINWRSLNKQQKNTAGAWLGWDYGTVAGISYGRVLLTKFPMIATLEFSPAFGKQLTDDFKTTAHLQAEIFSVRHFSLSVKAGGIFRRYENDFARMLNFGGLFSATAGYYARRWFVAGEFGFDKAVITQIKNSDVMKDSYPGVKDGWYLPAGGHFMYGLTGNYSFNDNGLFIQMGRLAGQDFKTPGSFPFYGKIGYTRKW